MLQNPNLASVALALCFSLPITTSLVATAETYAATPAQSSATPNKLVSVSAQDPADSGQLTTTSAQLAVQPAALATTNATKKNITKQESQLTKSEMPISLAPMLQRVMPSMVSISGLRRIRAITPGPGGDNNAAPSSKQLEEQLSVVLGSGVIVDAKNNYILTNQHVVDGLEDLRVTLYNNRKYDAKVIGSDKDSDLALLALQTHGQSLAEPLVEVKFADSDKVASGDFVVAIGNPYGFNHTVTFGIVSAVGRNTLDADMDTYYDFIQTDAAINMGSSGGALLNLTGELVGINSAIIAPSKYSGNVGLGLSLPANTAKAIMVRLAQTGHVDRGSMGVRVQDMSKELALGFGLANKNIQKPYGALINDILPNSPASKAGLEIGDIIIELNYKKVKDSLNLLTMISLLEPGKEVAIKIIREGKFFTKKLTLLNPESVLIDGGKVFSGLAGAMLENLFDGSTASSVAKSSVDLQTELAELGGVKISKIKRDSLAVQTELEEGDIIINANQHKVDDIEGLKAAVSKRTDVLLLQVLRANKYTLFIAVLAANASS